MTKGKMRRAHQATHRQYTITVPAEVAEQVERASALHKVTEAQLLRTCLPLGVAMALRHPVPDEQAGAAQPLPQSEESATSEAGGPTEEPLLVMGDGGAGT